MMATRQTDRDAHRVDVDQYTTPRIRAALRRSNDELRALQGEVRRVARRALRARLEYEAHVGEKLTSTIGVRAALDDETGAAELLDTVASLADDVRSVDEAQAVGRRPIWWVEEAVVFRGAVPWVDAILEDLAEGVEEHLASCRVELSPIPIEWLDLAARFEKLLAGEPARYVPVEDPPVRGPGRPAFVWDAFDADERDVIREHLQWMRLRNLRPNTIDSRLRTLSMIRYGVGVAFLDATTDQLGAWMEFRSSNVSAGTRAVDLSHLRSFYKWAVLFGHRTDDPTLRLVRPKLPRRLPRPMPDDDVDRALAEAPPVVSLILHLAAFAGLRAHEIAQLEREDIHDSKQPPVLLVRCGKGAQARIVPLAPEIVTVLRRTDVPASGPLFPRADGMPVSRSRICQQANGHLSDLGIEHTLHTLRHWFGSKLYAATNDIRLTQELMGHSSPTTTAGYAAWSPERGHDAVTRLRPLT